MLPERPLTLAQVAEHLQCSDRTVRREIAAGRLAAIRIRGMLRVAPDDLAVYLSRSKTETAWPSESEPTDTRSESRSLADSVLSALCPPALPEPTHGRSKLRSFAARSKMRVVDSQPA
jgi:excisionase family DNA binding protein